MIATLVHNSKSYQVDLNRPIDLSVALRGDGKGLSAWYVPSPSILPHKDGDFTGSIKMGGAVNFNDIQFNPHAHVTHTECVGHITEEIYSINAHMDKYFFIAELISIGPESHGEDVVISAGQLTSALVGNAVEALIIRTLPNTPAKLTRKYDHTNPPYLLEEAATYIREMGIQHLLVDLPSIDKEQDEGALLAHKAYWDLEGTPRFGATITEFVYVPDAVKDGSYLLNLQVAPIENDASPSRPVLYKMTEIEK